MKNSTVAFLLAMLACLSLPHTSTVAQVSANERAFREGTVTVNGLRFHYLEWPNASAPAMLLLPGTGGGGGCAEYWIPFASAMRDRYHIYAMEQRGQCDSEWAKEYTWQRVVEDIDAFVDKLHLAPVTIVGHSSGAVWGYLYAAQHPAKVAGLIAVDGGGAFNWPKTRAEAQQRAPLATRQVTFSSPEEAVTYAKTRWRTDPSVDAVVREWVLHGIRKLDDGRWGWRQDPAAVAATDQYIFLPIEDELNGAFPRIKCPTLIVRGSEGAVSRELANQVAHAIANGSWAEVANSGHVVPLANPSGFLAVVEKFLAGDPNPKDPKTADNSKAEQEVLRAEEERRQALLHNDAATMARLLADESVVTDVQGRVHDKADEVSLYRDTRRQTESWEPSEVKARIYGDAAVVTQRAAVKDVLEGERRNVDLRITHVWVKRDGRWQVVARHATRISEPPRGTTGVTTSQLDKRSAAAPHTKSSGEPPPSSKSEQEINRIRAESRRAFLEGDYDTIDRLWADDFFSTTSWGAIRTKAESLQGLRKGERKFLSLDYDDSKVRIYGDAALETGRVTYRGLSGEQEIPGNARYTLVFIKQPVGWRCVAHQATNIAQTPTASNAAPADAASGKVVEQEVIDLMSRLEEAHHHADTAFFEHVYASDFSAITPSGELASRAQVMQAWKSGAVKYDSYGYDDVRVRVYEEAAVVTNRSTRKGHIKGQEASGQFRQTRVFVKRDGNWQLVATQVTQVASPATAISKPPESSAHSTETTDDIQQIMCLIRERDEAAGRGDGAALAALVDERFSFVSPRGRLLDKKRYVANRTKGTATMEGVSVRHEDVDVHLYGDTAVATSRNISTGRAADGDFSGEFRETDTWIRRDGKWKLVALHLSPINYTGAHTAEMTQRLKITGAEELTWAASANVPGQLEAVVDGSSYNGPYVLRVRRPDGHFDPPHVYESAEELTVLSGTLHIAMGEHPDRANAQTVRAGGHVVVPARTPHYSWAEGETVTESFWAGPAYPRYLALASK